MIGDKRNANYCHQSERPARAPLRILKHARRKTSASFVILASIQLALRHLVRMKVCKRMSEGTFARTRGNDDNAPIPAIPEAAIEPPVRPAPNLQDHKTACGSLLR